MSTLTPTEIYSGGDKWAATIEKLFNCSEDEADGIIQSLYTDDATITVDGKLLSRDAIKPYSAAARAVTDSITIQKSELDP
jgi:hypothetical protein